MAKRRFYAIDNLRTSMMFIVMFGHPLLPYLTVPRSFKDPSAHIAFDVVAVFLYAFAMQAFFVTAGFTAALLLERKGAYGLLKNRFTRIFLPLLAAYIIISPLMRAAYDFAKGVVEFESINAGWAVILAGEWVRWSKLYHLWFLLSLLLFTGLAVLCLWLIRRLINTQRLAETLAVMLKGRAGVIILLLAASLTTIPSYILDTGRGTHWSMQITLFGYFALGWFLYSRREIIASWHFPSYWPLLTALLLWPICAWASRTRLFEEHNVDLLVGAVAGLSNGIIGMGVTITLLVWFHIHLNKPTRIGDALGVASYWVYLIHFPIVVAAGGLVAVLDLPALVKYLLTLAIAIPLIGLSYYTVVLKTPLKYVIGNFKRKQA